MIYSPEDITGLPFVEELCWKLLSAGVSDRKSAMHQVVVSTAVADVAHMRTVVLRRADIKEKSLYFHTDLRSSKVDDLKQNGMLSWLTYDQSLRTQIRLSGPTIIHHNDEICKEHWSKTGHHSRRYYMLDTDSNKVLSDRSTGLSPSLTAFDYTLEDSEVGFDYFAVVETKVNWMEWYFTHSTGNLRASFDYDASSLVESRWLAP